MIGLESAGALWALSSLVLLLLFSLWRSRPRKILVSSTVLWRRIPARMPPLKAARRPRFSLSLVAQALAVSAIIVALAGPFVEGTEPTPKRIAVVVDTSARMTARRADGRTRFDAARDMAMAAARELSPSDDVRVLWIEEAPRRREGKAKDLAGALESIRPIHAGVEVERLFAGVDEGEVWFLSDRAAPRPGCVEFLSGEEAENTGIVTVAYSGEELFLRLVRHGGAREVRLRIALDGRDFLSESILLSPGPRSWWKRIGAVEGRTLTAEIGHDDPFVLDDRAALVRFDPHDGVRLGGREHPLLARALQAVPGLRVGTGRTAVLYRTLEGAGETTVYVDPPESPSGFVLGERFEPRSWGVADHLLVRHLRAEELSAHAAREVQGGTPLLFADGRPVAALSDRQVVLAFELTPGGWTSTPSFPIFWTNVIRFARTHAAWRTLRAGEESILPGDTTEVHALAPDARYRYDPERRGFVPYTVGTYRGGGVDWEASLLEETQSDCRGVSSKGAVGGRLRDRARVNLASAVCGAALALVLWVWWIDRRR